MPLFAVNYRRWRVKVSKDEVRQMTKFLTKRNKGSAVPVDARLDELSLELACSLDFDHEPAPQEPSKPARKAKSVQWAEEPKKWSQERSKGSRRLFSETVMGRHAEILLALREQEWEDIDDGVDREWDDGKGWEVVKDDELGNPAAPTRIQENVHLDEGSPSELEASSHTPELANIQDPVRTVQEPERPTQLVHPPTKRDKPLAEPQHHIITPRILSTAKSNDRRRPTASPKEQATRHRLSITMSASLTGNKLEPTTGYFFTNPLAVAARSLSEHSLVITWMNLGPIVPLYYDEWGGLFAHTPLPPTYFDTLEML
ncbi:hypothetical protein EJ06DRAFT_557891 [Trichodelitschia bisporula]|uniref:Uncharacterized protein n=1 Tax=Trichodelitschia bisporula TaxID=703511 RepID=A0A6G1HRN8_9PEZI|nr:hypothetical protein EJ06DRAFT_557891 [Trichodelitschia bisporula]